LNDRSEGWTDGSTRKEHSLKALRCLLVTFLLLSSICALAGCTLTQDPRNAKIEYAGNRYEYFGSPRYFGITSAYTTEKVEWQGKELTVRVYDDPLKRFIYVEDYHSVYHREGAPIPDYTDVGQIEKAAIQFTSGPSVVLDEAYDLIALVELLNVPRETKTFRSNSPFRRYIAEVYVYYKDYPAYQQVGNVIQAKDGSYGITSPAYLEDGMSLFDFFYDYKYIPIPNSSPLLQYLQ